MSGFQIAMVTLSVFFKFLLLLLQSMTNTYFEMTFPVYMCYISKLLLNTFSNVQIIYKYTDYKK